MSNPVLAAKHLSKTFSDGKQQLSILHDINFSINAGESVAIIGASGSGKSTLLHILGGLDLPTQGEVQWGGRKIDALSQARLCGLRNQQLGFVYQFHHLLPEFNALENVCMPLFLKAIPFELARKKAADMLERVGLAKRRLHRIAQLSGGERQRVAIARALVTEPACVLADEPTGNLDQKTASNIMSLMLDLQTNLKTSLIIVTHDEKIASLMQTCYALENGQLSERKT